MSCEDVIHTAERCQRDLRWTVIATYSPTARPTMRAIATVSSLIAHSVMTDGLELMTTFSDFAITRRGRYGDVLVPEGRRRYAQCNALSRQREIQLSLH